MSSANILMSSFWPIQGVHFHHYHKAERDGRKIGIWWVMIMMDCNQYRATFAHIITTGIHDWTCSLWKILIRRRRTACHLKSSSSKPPIAPKRWRYLWQIDDQTATIAIFMVGGAGFDVADEYTHRQRSPTISHHKRHSACQWSMWEKGTKVWPHGVRNFAKITSNPD